MPDNRGSSAARWTDKLFIGPRGMPLNWEACWEMAGMANNPRRRFSFRPGIASCWYMAMVVPLRVWRSRLPLPFRLIFVLVTAAVGYAYFCLGILVYSLPAMVIVAAVLVAVSAVFVVPVLLLGWLLGLVGLGSAATAMFAFVGRYSDKITHGIGISHDIHEMRASKREEREHKDQQAASGGHCGRGGAATPRAAGPRAAGPRAATPIATKRLLARLIGAIDEINECGPLVG
jgi:hypothetical protein